MAKFKLTQNVLDFMNKCSEEIGRKEDDRFNVDIWCFFEDHENEIKSPIEQILYCALQMVRQFNDIEKGDPIDIDGKIGVIGLSVFPQSEVGKYRADFSVSFGQYNYKTKKFTYKTILIECDSQEFHERSESERRYEKERDRFFIKEGHEVFHYTGKEIYHNALNIAVEIISYVTGIKQEDLAYKL